MKPRPLTVEEEQRYGAELDRAIERVRDERRAASLRIAADQPWLIVQANPNRERRAALSLEDLGFEVWVPEIVREMRVGRPRPHAPNACRKFPVVGGMLLARHANPWAWTGLQNADGVRGIVAFGQHPALAPHARVVEWRENLIPLPVPLIEDSLIVGSDVLITQGPLAGFAAIVERLTGRSAAIVSVTIFGQQTAATVAREHLDVA